MGKVIKVGWKDMVYCPYLTICPAKSPLCFSSLYWLCEMYQIISKLGYVPYLKMKRIRYIPLDVATSGTWY